MNKRPSPTALRARILGLRWRRAHAAMRVLAADSIASQVAAVGADGIALMRASGYQIATTEALREIEHQLRRCRRALNHLKEYRA
ncbi:hypothetical protein [Methyloversatilis sp.]|uniref:hypothetical protein n=1 Tax=Methyloversatilis sp. TaxID=2569862 RepID=UPI003D2C44FE